MRWSRAAAARVAAEQREHEVAADQLGLDDGPEEYGPRLDRSLAIAAEAQAEGQQADMAPYAQAEGSIQLGSEHLVKAIDDLNRHRHEVVFDFGKGWVVAITDTGEQFHMWIDSVELESGAVTVNGVMRPVTDIPYTIVGYEVYGDDGQVVARRPVNPSIEFTPSDDEKRDVQSMMIRWTIRDEGQVKLAQKEKAE